VDCRDIDHQKLPRQTAILSLALHFTFIDSINATAIGVSDPGIILQRFISASTTRHSETTQQSSRHGGT
jgi:hypothetical protein